MPRGAVRVLSAFVPGDCYPRTVGIVTAWSCLVVCLGYAAVDVVIQTVAGKAEEEAIPGLYGQRRQRSEATSGRHRRRQVISQTDH